MPIQSKVLKGDREIAENNCLALCIAGLLESLRGLLEKPDVFGNIHSRKRKCVKCIADAILVAGLLAEFQCGLGGAAR
ncbi:MAG: hypothetical protein ABSF99_13390, partial [Anaerolineales bacterium]